MTLLETELSTQPVTQAGYAPEMVHPVLLSSEIKDKGPYFWVISSCVSFGVFLL